MPIKAKQLDTSGILERDAAPTLGADLDIGASNSIVATGSKDISITPDAGSVILDGMSWPQADGTADQVLKTNGAGQLSWTDVTSGLSSTDDLPEGTTNFYYTDTKVDTRIAAANIDDLSDVAAPAPSDGDVLQYSSSSSSWSAQPASSGASRPTVTKQSGTTVTLNAPSSSDLEHIYYFTASTAVTVTLPSASGITGYKLNLKRIGTGAVTINPVSGESIDASTSISLATQYDSYTLVSDGLDWLIL